MHVALVEFSIANERDHPSRLPVTRTEPLCPHVILGEAGEQRHGDAEADRARGEIHVVGVLGARGIGLRSAQRAEALQLLACLPAQQILDRVKHRARVRLDRDAIGRAQDVEIERGHQGGDGSGRRLVPADLHAIAIGPHEVGVMDHPGAEPQHLLLQRTERCHTEGVGLVQRWGTNIIQGDRWFRHARGPPRWGWSLSAHPVRVRRDFC